MKTVSEKELSRMKKRGGVKMKRRLGTKQKPEPVATDDIGLSGSVPTEQPVPAPAPVIDMQPMAAMAASMAARDAQLETVIVNNTKAVDKFRTQLTEQANKVKKKVSWRHKIKRSDKLLIDEVISSPIEN